MILRERGGGGGLALSIKMMLSIVNSSCESPLQFVSVMTVIAADTTAVNYDFHMTSCMHNTHIHIGFHSGHFGMIHDN